MLTDWTDKKREWVFEELKKQSDSYNFHQRTVGDFLRDVRNRELSRTIADKKAWGEMRTNATDLADVPGCTYLMNGAALAGNWTGLFRPGERVQLRFINGSGITYFDVRMSSSWATPHQIELGCHAAVTQPTVYRWLTVLETSYQLVRLPSYAVNRTKRIIKRPRRSIGPIPDSRSIWRAAASRDPESHRLVGRNRLPRWWPSLPVSTPFA